jgi:hypothetical protein
MRRVGLFAVTCAVLASPLAGRQSPSLATATVRVIVERAQGSFLEQFGAQDVAVFIGGLSRQVLEVAVERRPVSWVLLVDVSQSMVRGGRPGADIAIHDFQGNVRGIADGLVKRLFPPDRLLVVRFAGHRVWTLGSWSEDQVSHLAATQMLLDPVDRTQVRGPSPIWDAVASASGLLESQAAPRAIVLVTDGHATANTIGVVDAAAAAAQREAPVFVMHEPFWTGQMNKVLGPGERFLRPLAAHSGGMFRVNDSNARVGWQDPLPDYDDFIDAMRHQHVVQVDVTGLAPGRYPLEVRATEAGSTVHASAWIWVD